MRWVSAVIAGGSVIAVSCGGSESGFQLEQPPAECMAFTVDWADELLIANEIMAETSSDPLYSEADRDQLASEIRPILQEIRGRHPSLEEIGAPPHSPLQVSIKLRSDAAKRFLARTDTTFSNFAVSRTGDRAIDLLSESLGLKAYLIDVWRGNQSVHARLCLSDLVNSAVAKALYEELESVEYADAEGFIGDSSALNMRKFDGKWYVVFREAGGDCPAGCTIENFTFFIADGSGVVEIPEMEAQSSEQFATVVGLARWGLTEREWP